MLRATLPPAELAAPKALLIGAGSALASRRDPIL
jgi:hypothetical protein